jgi:hypothetical protein
MREEQICSRHQPDLQQVVLFHEVCPQRVQHILLEAQFPVLVHQIIKYKVTSWIRLNFVIPPSVSAFRRLFCVRFYQGSRDTQRYFDENSKYFILNSATFRFSSNNIFIFTLNSRTERKKLIFTTFILLHFQHVSTLSKSPAFLFTRAV